MTESLPATGYVRESYAREKHPDSPELIELRRQGFDRWLRQVRAQAWDDGFTEGHHTPSERESGDINCDCRNNPHREKQ